MRRRIGIRTRKESPSESAAARQYSPCSAALSTAAEDSAPSRRVSGAGANRYSPDSSSASGDVGPPVRITEQAINRGQDKHLRARTAQGTENLVNALPPRFRVDVRIKEGTSSSADEANKQLGDKERVAAAMENRNLIDMVNHMLSSCE